MRDTLGTDDWISVTTAAAIVGVTASTVRKWEQYGYFVKCRRIGQGVQYREGEVRAWLASPDRALPPPGKARVGDGHQNSTYPKEFMAQAIKMRTDGKSLGQIGIALGVPKGTVAKWCSDQRRVQCLDDLAVRAAAKQR